MEILAKNLSYHFFSGDVEKVTWSFSLDFSFFLCFRIDKNIFKTLRLWIIYCYDCVCNLK